MMGWIDPFAMLLLMACVSVVVTLGNPVIANFTDRSALLSFRAQISNDPHKIMANNWSSATPFCSWLGVTCSAQHQRVTALNLPNMGLGGIIPPEMGNLSFLVSINLSNNSFHGHLPNELANLQSLESMNFGYNNFNGEIPSGFGMLPRLQHLLFANNSLTGTLPLSVLSIRKLETLILEGNSLEGNIPEEIGNLANLRILRLGHNYFSGAIPAIVFNMSSLQVIDLQGNNFFGGLPGDMCNQPSKLEVLDLGFNQLEGPIPSTFYKCTDLQVVNLHGNKFTGSILGEIGRLQRLTELYLSKNYLTGNMPREIGNCTALKVIDMHTNNLTGIIPHELGHLHNLQELDLSFNNVTGSIPSTFSNFSMLKRLNLDYNRLSGSLPSNFGHWFPKLAELSLEQNELSGPIPESIGNASQLVVLDLSSNSFSGFIPDSLGNIRNLQKINLANNILTRKSSSQELSFLSSLSNCRNLTWLTLSGNPLNGIIPASIANLSNSLQFFYAHDCGFKGKLPQELGNVSNLIGLILQNNEFIGTIPSEIGRLQYLQDFSVGNNKLHGQIPYELCHLRSLGYLFLYQNELSGSIPACWSDLKSLREIYMAYNRFTAIPSTFWRLTDMVLINLSSNSLSGLLPSEIQNLKVVTTIDLSGNQLSGDIPNSIGDLKNLAYLSLSHNKLHGSILQSIGDLVSLETLDLSRNNLSGIIPKSLEKLWHLKYLNVSSNRLQGEIPSGGPFTNFSKQSFMDNEALCGPIKFQVPQCRSGIIRHSNKHGLSTMRYIAPVVAFTIVVTASVIIIIRSCKRNKKLSPEEGFLPLRITAWRRFSYQDLARATGGFDETNLLGHGSVGIVYKGTLLDARCIAVKVFNFQLERAFTTFDVECQVLSNIRHRNLVKIISSCCTLDFRALVLEFMPNGSLEKWLYSHNYFLDILQRLNIMMDVAAALEYLHYGCDTPVVHSDLKPSNILIDEKMVAHVADFGLAKLLCDEDSLIQTMTLATIGYMAPEYGSKGIVSTRGDVYSYGILLMETFTRTKPTDEMFVGETSLKQWVKEYLSCEVTQVIDANLLKPGEQHFAAKKNCIGSILKLALACSADVPEERICMKDVHIALKKIKQNFQKDIECVPSKYI